MKMFDLKSLLIGALLTMTIVVIVLIATANRAPVLWEYQVIYGAHTRSTYQNRINSAAADGWEVVGVSADSQNGSFAVMRKPKAVRRSTWWRFWK